MDISRKILPPPLPAALLPREQLSHILGEALNSSSDTHTLSPYRLVLLCAPAGYGKTTLLVDTIQRFALPCCWLTLDRSDQQCSTFLATLLASICQCFPAVASQLRAVLEERRVQEERSSERMMDALIDLLATTLPGPLVLVLCNYQEVNDSPQINNLTNQLLKRLPPRCLLVIESRALPDLELASFIAHRQIFGLGGESLRFSAQEVYTLAQIQGLRAFSEEAAAQLVSAFDGWIAGMLLASRLGKASFEAFTPSHLHTQEALFTDVRQLLTFVVTDVFRDETAIYTLLKETSLLDRLAPAFCDALLHTSNTATLLERAERQGLFVSCAHEAGKHVYHCHPVLRKLLQEELCLHEQNNARSLHRRAATLYYQGHAYQAALTHALEAQEHDLVAEILLNVSRLLLDQGQSELILRGLDGLPLQIMEEHPRLLLIQMNTYLRRGDVASVRRCFEQKQHLATALMNSEDILTRAEFAIVQGKLLLQQGAYLPARKKFQVALEQLPIDERVLRLLAHQQCGICSNLSGQPIHEGIAHFQQALQLCHSQREPELVGELHHQLANAYTWAGNYAVAEHHRHYIRGLQDRLGQPQKIMNNLIGLGLLKLRQGLVEEAEAAFQSTLQLTQQSPRFLSTRAYALVGLGEVALTRRDTPQALSYLQEALDLARQLEDRYLLNDTLGMLALAYLQLDERYTARSLLEQMVLQTQEARSYESTFQQLVYGTILLAEQRYDKAEEVLRQVTQLTGESGVQWLQAQALLRLAACRLAQGQHARVREAIQSLHLLNTQGNHDACIEGELQNYPLLQSFLQEKSQQKDHPEVSVLPTKRLCIHALGEPVVLLDGNAVTGWRRARALELFFLLLERKQPLRKDRIIPMLWPESDNDEILNQTFRSTVYCIRQALGDACLVYQSGLYQLNLHAIYDQFWYDVTAFEEYERIAKIALETEDDQQAELAYTDMIKLYRGKYAEAFYSDWCSTRRDALHQSLLEARRQLALIAWRRDAWEESLQHWQHLLTLDPCLETAHYGIMRCYSRQGKRDLALRQYQRCQRELYEQLGAEPSASLQKLYQRLAKVLST